jgi:hypothetical protein
MYIMSGRLFIGLGLITLVIGVLVFLGWSWRSRQWPFANTLSGVGPL